MNDRKIERSNWCGSRSVGRQQVLVNFIKKFIQVSHEKQVTRRGPIFTKNETLFDSRTESESQHWQYLFLMRAGRGPQQRTPTRKRPVFVLVSPTRPTCAGARPKELGH